MTVPRLQSTLDRLKADPELVALRRSLDVYYGDDARDLAMDALYARFLSDVPSRSRLAFDIGSHVGDRIGSFRRCGARVVALEPQPDCARVIREIHGCDGAVTLEADAGDVGADEGRVRVGGDQRLERVHELSVAG